MIFGRSAPDAPVYNEPSTEKGPEVIGFSELLRPFFQTHREKSGSIV
jgi:hypothetical protein